MQLVGNQFTCPVHQEGGDTVRRCEMVRGRVQRRQLLLVPAQELHEAAEDVLHVRVVSLEVGGQEVGVPGVLDASIFVANGNGVKRGDEVVPSLQTIYFIMIRGREKIFNVKRNTVGVK